MVEKETKRAYQKPDIEDEMVFAPSSGACGIEPYSIYNAEHSNVTGACGKDQHMAMCHPTKGGGFGHWQSSL